MVGTEPRGRWETISLLATMTAGGMGTSLVGSGAVDRAVFDQFVADALLQTLVPGQIVVLETQGGVALAGAMRIGGPRSPVPLPVRLVEGVPLVGDVMVGGRGGRVCAGPLCQLRHDAVGVGQDQRGADVLGRESPRGGSCPDLCAQVLHVAGGPHPRHRRGPESVRLDEGASWVLGRRDADLSERCPARHHARGDHDDLSVGEGRLAGGPNPGNPVVPDLDGGHLTRDDTDVQHIQPGPILSSELGVLREEGDVLTVLTEAERLVDRERSVPDHPDPTVAHLQAVVVRAVHEVPAPAFTKAGDGRELDSEAGDD